MTQDQDIVERLEFGNFVILVEGGLEPNLAKRVADKFNGTCAEGARLQDAKRRALQIADERAKENVDLRARVAALATESADLAHDLKLQMEYAERDRARVAALEGVLQEANGCFDAALVEGWEQAVVDGNVERLSDLWHRRLSFAYRAIFAVLNPPNAGENRGGRKFTGPGYLEQTGYIDSAGEAPGPAPRSAGEVRNCEAQVYNLSAQDLGPKVHDGDRLISEAVYKNKRHLGPRGMMEYALVVARECLDPPKSAVAGPAPGCPCLGHPFACFGHPTHCCCAKVRPAQSPAGVVLRQENLKLADQIVYASLGRHVRRSDVLVGDIRNALDAKDERIAELEAARSPAGAVLLAAHMLPWRHERTRIIDDGGEQVASTILEIDAALICAAVNSYAPAGAVTEEMVARAAKALAYCEGGQMVGPGRNRATDEFGWKGDGVHFEQYAEAHWQTYADRARAAITAARGG